MAAMLADGRAQEERARVATAADSAQLRAEEAALNARDSSDPLDPRFLKEMSNQMYGDAGGDLGARLGRLRHYRQKGKVDQHAFLKE